MRENAVECAVAQLSESLGEDCEALLDDDDLIAIFGKKYAKSPENFTFLPGEKNTIKSLVEHVKKLVDGNGENTGLKKFNQSRKKATKNSTHSIRINAAANVKTDRQISPTIKGNTGQLFERLHACLKKHGVKVDDWTANSIEVEPNGIYGIIHCQLCGEKKRVYYNHSGKSSFWTVSNFEKHLKTVHNLKANQLTKTKPKSRQNRNQAKPNNERQKESKGADLSDSSAEVESASNSTTN